MGRITIKGGTWKNTEDEILKAAVMKYGKNQWSRISSLLVRKSATQCKARWYEWLDPSIKKTEWSREEEEKLLHLAKIMPCQWRTIAPMLGRTASQALEKYEELLDAAQNPEAAAAAAGGKPSIKDRLEDPRRLRPGEIDPIPEAKPARPDPQDMDEDEKEMLSEARARLANTKGKKAKRKAREKQLEEARRLAVLQKQRELRAAGIEPKVYHKRKLGIDYLEEVPFEHKPAKGFYDTREEDSEFTQKKLDKGWRNVSLQELEGKSRDVQEMEERKKDAKRLKLFKTTNLPEALLKINAINDPQRISRRMDMALPEPQINEAELAEIAKLGGQMGAATPMRGGAAATPMRTPLRPDTILSEAQNLLSYTQQNSSLLGGENTPLVGESDFSGVKPRSSAVSTPNMLASPLHAPSGGATPRSAVPGTPLRDGLGINAAPTSAASSSMSAAQAIQSGRARVKKVQNRALASALANLPAPTNEFALVLPEVQQKPASESKDGMAEDEDAEDLLARAHNEARNARAAAWKAESQVIQRGLPRPSVLNLASSDSSDPVTAAIESEMMRLVQYDHAKYPPSIDGAAAGKRKRSKLPALDAFSDYEVSTARALIDAELTAANGGRALSATDLSALLREVDVSAWSGLVDDQMFFPSTKQFGSVSAHAADGGDDALLVAYKQHFALLKSAVQSASKRAGKLEQNLSVLVGGYQGINARLHKEIMELHARLTEALKNRNCFAALAANESYAMPMRKAELQQLYAMQQEKERELQRKYQALNQAMQDARTAAH